MGRRAFLDDLKDASVPGQIKGVSRLCAGDDDGTVKFMVRHDALPLDELHVEALLSDVTEYPSGHSYFIFTSSDNVPKKITNALQRVQNSVAGYTLSKMLLEVFSAILRAPSEEPTESLSEPELLNCTSDDEQVDDDDDDGLWFDGEAKRPSLAKKQAPTAALLHADDQSNKTRKRMREDLCAVRLQGFKVGILGSDEACGIACISIRIAKLGISEEAIDAWGLEKGKYLVLLIRYLRGYQTLEQVAVQSGTEARLVHFAVGTCAQYKPSLEHARPMFYQQPTTLNHAVSESQRSSSQVNSEPDAMKSIFIAKPMEDLLNQLPDILRCRRTWSLSWSGAELLANEMKNQAVDYPSIIDMEKYRLLTDATSRVLPSLATADHLQDKGKSQSLSLPLAAMQFVVRHIVRCTEFCVVCHCKLDSDFEALKPFVCSNPLCIYQYMTLGFGPSIEYEIVNQPYVVDLLISLCYISARGNCLKDFPVGMRLKVPVIKVGAAPSVAATAFPRNYAIASPPIPSTIVQSTVPNQPGLAIPSPPVNPKVLKIRSFQVSLDVCGRKVTFNDKKAFDSVNGGDWVAFVTDHNDYFTFHARIEHKHFPDVNLGPIIRQKLHCQDSEDPISACPGAASSQVMATLYPYEHDFDDLDGTSKMLALLTIINTIPDVVSMNSRLETEKGTLKEWKDRISDTALNVLRWIISSNRSCLMQVDCGALINTDRCKEQRVIGMTDWMQFRFAQGAPDKEQRFVDQVNQKAQSGEKSKFPTIFAWHGSSLSNWHSIIREGLHFQKTTNGRAYGNGVYMSLLATTSLGYTNDGFLMHRGNTMSEMITKEVAPYWPRSNLQVNGVMALTEIVNAPKEFISITPHLVVDKLDWIQTRYLFVKSATKEPRLQPNKGPSKPERNAAVYTQDPHYTPRDSSNRELVIPITAISKSRRPAEYVLHRVTSDGKKAKVIDFTNQDEAEKLHGDAASIVTTASDAEWTDDRMEDDEPARSKSPAVGKSSEASAVVARVVSETDFVPDSLDPSTLPLLKPPTSGSSSATKTLLALLTTTLKIQSSTPPAELGWYITDSIISNIYQWPFELHSFPTDLPLAIDLRAANLTSIVLELRFPTSFPMSPPFVRVIRPRFLSFMAGGGGHVTAGGALCMELLTNTGWSPANSLESILLQVRMAICSTDPRPARLEIATSRNSATAARIKTDMGVQQQGKHRGGEYGVMEAIQAYKRACLTHGWEVPKDFDQFMEQS